MNGSNVGKVIVIGGGLAGSEAAWQLAQRGIPVILYEMRPVKQSPAHRTALLAELVCSNSFRAADAGNAVGILKEELRVLNSLIIGAADAARVPAGGALAVDREKFAEAITTALSGHQLVEIRREEVSSLAFPDDQIIIIASGPLTSPALAESIRALVAEDYLYFYDAAAPIVAADSLDRGKVFCASRYDKGEPAYLNCPFTREEYLVFWQELCSANTAQIKDFEKEIYFEGCMPIEEMARRGVDTMRYGPLKPVGLRDPVTGDEPYAVVQLRQENIEGSMYNLVGFQTHLTWPEQRRVFGLIPGLAKAEFLRYGVMHRNTYVNGPKTLERDYSLRGNPAIYLAGQITGVEGYVESTASGMVAGINAARKVRGETPVVFPAETAVGALANYVSTSATKDFQPMNINFGIMPPAEKKFRKKREKNLYLSERSLAILTEFMKKL